MADIHKARTIRILIASPSDVEKERDLAEQIINRLKIRCENNLQLVLEPKRWEFDVPAKMGKPAQDLINEELVDDCDCAVCVFWKRIGTGTEAAEGGAVEELERMLKAKKPVLLYFSDVEVALSKVDRQQWNALEDWKEKLWKERRGLPKTYKEHNDFEKQLKNDLETLLQKFCDDTESVVAKSQPLYPELEQRYNSTLKEELGKIKLLGSPDIDSVQVNLDDTFVPLRISHSWKTDDRFKAGRGEPSLQEEMRHHTPDEMMQCVFPEYRMLLVIGDPGSGKTTLLKYYSLCCLQNRHERLFGDMKPVRVFYLPLRDLMADEKGNYHLLPEQLSLWSMNYAHSIDADVFREWLSDESHRTLVLLDGLDEISDLERRKVACGWIDRQSKGFNNAFFVVTSRITGYRKVEGVELTADHIRADVMDFTTEQQEEFLRKWFSAAFIREPAPAGNGKKVWQDKQQKKAEERTTKIAKYLQKPENSGLRELAVVPMMLQIMAILFKERDFLPGSRVDLYSASLDYLLEFRDGRRKLKPLLPAKKARLVLSPVALWMQEILKTDEAERAAMHDEMQKVLATLDQPPRPEEFCKNLVDRAGLLVSYGDKAQEYLFRHKTFREYLAGAQLVEKTKRTAGHIASLVAHFGDDWWNEPLKFFMGQVDAEMFDQFMEQLLDHQVSEELSSKQQTLLETLVEEAPQKKIDALCEKLLDAETSVNRQRYILDCLKAVGKTEALKALYHFKKQQPPYYGVEWNEKTDEYKKIGHVSGLLEEVISSLELVLGQKENVTIKAERETANLTDRPPSFRNPYEHDSRCILIPGGEYKYSLTKEEVAVPDLYVAKYPVTNRQYRSFIDFLAGNPFEFDKKLSLSHYEQALHDFAQNGGNSVKGLSDYLHEERDPVKRFRSRYDDDRKFNKDDQPVVGVSWFAATAYCLWLSLLQSGGKETGVYRLPTEVEWEWAAGGRRDKPDKVLEVRKYPWGDDPEPTEKHANFNNDEGATTPVGRYPDGATPEGLYDMAGNVWEWMGNWSSGSSEYKALRGGSWDYSSESLVCSFRYGYLPVNWSFHYGGFRVVRPSPSSER